MDRAVARCRKSMCPVIERGFVDDRRTGDLVFKGPTGLGVIVRARFFAPLELSLVLWATSPYIYDT
jgi:hypothetical protein